MAQFPYLSEDNQPGILMPRLPMTLTYRQRSIDIVGLLDTGSSVNVLPFRFGLALGAVWKEQHTIVPLVGMLGQFEARALVVIGSHSSITTRGPIRLVFAWTQAEHVPVIFGQMNFF